MFERLKGGLAKSPNIRRELGSGKDSSMRSKGAEQRGWGKGSNIAGGGSGSETMNMGLDRWV